MRNVMHAKVHASFAENFSIYSIKWLWPFVCKIDEEQGMRYVHISVVPEKSLHFAQIIITWNDSAQKSDYAEP